MATPKKEKKTVSVLTLSDRIYDYIKESIIKNRIAPNQRINEREIAARFGASATPIREAVLRLYAEGFVEIHRYKQVMVREISSERLQDICRFMSLLDTHALKMAMKELTDEDFRELTAWVSEMGKNCRLETLDEFLTLASHIHKKIWSKVDNSVFYEALIRVYEKIQRYSYVKYSLFSSPEALAESLGRHKKLVEALKARKAAVLPKLAQEHWTL